MYTVESVKYGADTATSDIHLDLECFGYCSSTTVTIGG